MLCAEYLCGYLAEGGEDGVLVRRVSRLAARYTARVAETATEWAVNMRWLRVAQEAATPPSKRSPPIFNFFGKPLPPHLISKLDAAWKAKHPGKEVSVIEMEVSALEIDSDSDVSPFGLVHPQA